MEGLGLVDYGSDLDDDARSPGQLVMNCCMCGVLRVCARVISAAHCVVIS
jgi:hypothetical protein